MTDPAPRPVSASARSLGLAVLLLAGAAALAHASTVAWLCDDAFISFRYARHLAEGKGLVFNAGEAVEGYTNFLWTLLLAGGLRIGLAPEALSTTLGLVSFAGTAAVLAWAGHRSAPRDDRGFLPVAALCWLGIGHARLFATSGLETSFCALLFTAAAALAVEARTDRHWLALGVLGALATLTRPEGALVVAVAVVVALASGPRRGRALAGVLLPVSALLGPWLVWKLSFYGDLLPNTWHAKAGSGPQWSQGLRYVGLYLRTWPLVAAGVLAAGGLAIARRSRLGKAWEPGWSGVRAPLVLLGLAVPYGLHVLRVGGDFMFARFCLPWTPVLLLAVELALRRVPGSRKQLALGFVLAAATAATPPPPELDAVTGAPWHGITEQRAWYPEPWLDEARRQGAVIREMTRGLDYTAAYYGTQAMLMYYGEVPAGVEVHVGLTDREIARMPSPPGAAIGHGVKASLGYLQRRQVDLAFDFRLQQQLTPLNRVELGQGVTARLLVYRPDFVESLRARGAKVVDLPAFLDAYLANMDGFSDDKVAGDYAGLRTYYFQHAEDEVRQRAFEARLDGSFAPR